MIRKKIREWLGIEADEKTYWREKYLQENQIKHYASKIEHLESRIKELEGRVAEDRLLTENNGSMILNYEKNYFPKLEEVLERLEARDSEPSVIDRLGRLSTGMRNYIESRMDDEGVALGEKVILNDMYSYKVEIDDIIDTIGEVFDGI